MIVATLYEQLEGSRSCDRFQKEILKLWEKSWKNNGFETLILTKKDFSNSCNFENFCFKIEEINRKIYGDKFLYSEKNQFMWKYTVSTWKRWFLFSELNFENCFYCGDYDVINNKFSNDNQIDNEKLCFYSNCCPCFASGTSSQFLNFCNLAIKESEKNIEDIKTFFKKEKINTFYTDQQFLCFFESLAKKKFKLMFDKNILNPFGPDQNSKLVHFSHRLIELNFGSFSDVVRVKAIKNFLKGV